jgi:hypothetical protein
LAAQVIEVRVRIGDQRRIGEEVDRVVVAHRIASPSAGLPVVYGGKR